MFNSIWNLFSWQSKAIRETRQRHKDYYEAERERQRRIRTDYAFARAEALREWKAKQEHEARHAKADAEWKKKHPER